MNRRTVGDTGVAQALKYFVDHDYIVSIPFTESAPYDLVVQTRLGGPLQRVQCKRGTTFSKSNVPQIELRTSGGNQSWGGVVKTIQPDDTDWVWCSHGESAWLIPAKDVQGMKILCLGKLRRDRQVLG